tara:strand:+ start:32 stop:1177 length:1146 start_codon:yes stop_codon:yes gene_type:complete
MIKKLNDVVFLFLFCGIVCLIGCNNILSENSNETRSLSNHFKNHFHIGAAINENTILGNDNKSKEIVVSEFNSITPENSLKWMFIQPLPGKFDFKVSDKYVNIGSKNGMYTVGHALIWHSQLAEFMQNIDNKDETLFHVKNHINTLMNRYKGKIDAWDVVNEAFEEDGSFRESVFYKNLGKNYIEDVFVLAAKVDPEVDLIYNDYNLYKSEKRLAVINMVNKFKANGTKIDGVGVQAHWDLNTPSINEIENIILDFHETGILVSFTELDISVLPNPWEMIGAEVNQNFSKFEGDPKMNPYPNGLPNNIQDKLAKRYEDIFKLFLKHSDKINRVTFWGVIDKYSWLNDWPIKGRTNYPLLFDKDYKSKKAYYKLLELKTNHN